MNYEIDQGRNDKRLITARLRCHGEPLAMARVCGSTFSTFPFWIMASRYVGETRIKEKKGEDTDGGKIPGVIRDSETRVNLKFQISPG